MSLTLEDGTGLTSADTLLTVAEADAYHGGRGASTWMALDTTVKEQLIRKANDFLRQRYRLRWKGYRLQLNQALDWPRSGVQLTDQYFSAWFDPHSIPNEVKHALADLALRANSADLLPDFTTDPKSEQIGPIKVEYSTSNPQVPVYKAIDALLAPYLKAGSDMAVLSK